MNDTKSNKKPRTSAEVKNRYNNKAYDRMGIMVKKGEKDIIKARADELNMSMNEYIVHLINTDLKK